MADMKEQSELDEYTDLLLQCPFCGSYEVSLSICRRQQEEGSYVECEDCGSAGASFYGKNQEINASKQWNTRATDSTIEVQEAEIKRLREAYKICNDALYALRLTIRENTCSDNFRIEIISNTINEAQAALAEKGE